MLPNPSLIATHKNHRNTIAPLIRISSQIVISAITVMFD